MFRYRFCLRNKIKKIVAHINSNKPEKIVARLDAVIGKRRVEAVVKDHFPIADTIPEVLRLIGNIHNRINHCIVKRQIVLTCETQEIW